MSCGRGDGKTSNIMSSTSSNGAVAQLDVGLCSPSDLRGEHEEERSSCNTADLLLGHSPNGLLAPGRRETFGKSIGNVWEALVWQRDVRFANNGGDNSDKCPIRRRCI
eukprot:CCRYP_000620-RA/>CCRYP_000620-RA protein AED:0.02 eAED:0.02 QI:125/1/1/1/0/0/5/3246/107